MPIPKNIATMTDDERYRWWCSLPSREADRLSDRTFKGPAEYWVYWLKNGDVEGPDIRDTLEEAMVAAQQYAQSPACRIERVIGHYNVADASLQDREYHEVYLRGTFSD